MTSERDEARAMLRECRDLAEQEGEAALVTRIDAAQTDTEKACTWREDDDGIWHTDCEEAYQFSHDPPYDYMRYCCYCGKKAALIPCEDEAV